MIVRDTDHIETNSKKPAKSTKMLRLLVLTIAFATLFIIALTVIITLPVKTTYRYYLVHANSGLDIKMRVSDEWILYLLNNPG